MLTVDPRRRRRHAAAANACPMPRYGETRRSVGGADRGPAATLRPRRAAGAAAARRRARNAARLRALGPRGQAPGRRVWQLAGLAAPGPVVTAYTISLDTPEAMRAEAARHRAPAAPEAQARWRGRHGPARGGAPRRARRAARSSTPTRAGPPSPTPPWRRRCAGSASSWSSSRCRPARTTRWPSSARPLPVCADESCHDRASLAGLAGKYDMVNIKLDKTGGLTEAWRCATRRRGDGLRIMVGCMVDLEPRRRAGGADGAGGGAGRPRRRRCCWRATGRIRSTTTRRASIRRRRSSGGDMSRIVYVNGDYLRRRRRRSASSTAASCSPTRSTR